MEKYRTYVGTKIIQATPMDKATFSLKVRTMSDGVGINSDGKGEAGYKVIYPDGYVSWSPKAVFDEAYREISARELEMVLPLCNPCQTIEQYLREEMAQGKYDFSI